MKCIYTLIHKHTLDDHLKYKVAGLVSLFSTPWLAHLFLEEEKEVGQEEAEPLTGEEEEERRIADMGRPMLGDHPKLEVIIEESYEFKVC